MTSEAGAPRTGFSVADDAPVYAISVAAQLAGLHPQTLRQYDRLGLVTPTRVGGRNRLYSANNIAQLCDIAALARQGLPLHAITHILELRAENNKLRQLLNEQYERRRSTAIVLWQPRTTNHPGNHNP